MFKNFFEKKLWIIKNLRPLKNWYKRNFRSPSPSFIKLKILNLEINQNFGDKLIYKLESHKNDFCFLSFLIKLKLIQIKIYLFNQGYGQFKL